MISASHRSRNAKTLNSLPSQGGQDGLEIRAEVAARDALGQGATGGLAPSRATQARPLVLIDAGLDLGQFGDLMDQGVGVRAVQRVTPVTAGTGLAVAG
jgi:hypothetical protein